MTFFQAVKRALPTLIFGLALIASLPLAAEEPAAVSDNQSITALMREYESIVKVVELYIEGGRQGSSEIMKRAFHPDANIFGYVDGHPAGGPIQLLPDMAEGRAAGDIHYEITYLDVTGNIAMLKLDIPDWGGKHYSDMFTLLKMEDGEWKMVSKVSHTN